MTIFKTLYIFLIYIQDFLKILTLKAFKGNDKDISGKKKKKGLDLSPDPV